MSSTCPDPISPAAPAEGGLRLAVKLTPKAAADRIQGIAQESDGSAVLKIGVTAVPEDGKANARLISLLAKALRVAKGDITITQGATQRRKLLFIKGDAETLGRRIAELARTP